jgi:hypothetical protein
VLPLSDKRSGYRKLFNLYLNWSHDERHALERDLNVHHGENVLAILERLQEIPARRKRNGATLYKACVKERTAW